MSRELTPWSLGLSSFLFWWSESNRPLLSGTPRVGSAQLPLGSSTLPWPVLPSVQTLSAASLILSGLNLMPF